MWFTLAALAAAPVERCFTFPGVEEAAVKKQLCWITTIMIVHAMLLLSMHAPKVAFPLHLAARAEDPEMVDALLKAGADVNLKSLRNNFFIDTQEKEDRTLAAKPNCEGGG